MSSRIALLVVTAAVALLAACSATGQGQATRDTPVSGTPATLGQRTKTTGCHAADGLPDPACTPGAADPRVTPENIATTICKPGYSTSVRPPVSVTDRIKRDQYAAYGLAGLAPAATELDHLISLELGGAPADVANLWPEVYQQAWGARVKDRLENTLHDLVCSGKLPLRDAQHAIATDWIAAYHTYVAGDADPPDVASATPSEDEAANTSTGEDGDRPAASTPTGAPAREGGQATPAATSTTSPPGPRMPPRRPRRAS